MATLGLTDTCMRALDPSTTLWQFQILRSVVALMILFAASRLLGFAVWPKRWRAVAGRTALALTAMLIYFACIPILPIAVAAAGLFMCPVFIILFSALFFGERVGAGRLTAALGGLVGVFMVLDVNIDQLSWISMAPLAAGALLALSQIATNRTCGDESPWALVMVVYLAFLASGVAGVAGLIVWPAPPDLVEQAPNLFSVWAMPSIDTLALIAALAVVNLLCLASLTWAYQTGEPSRLGLCEYSFLIAATLAAWLVWGDAMDQHVWIGVALILASGVLGTLAGHPMARTPHPVYARISEMAHLRYNWRTPRR